MHASNYQNDLAATARVNRVFAQPPAPREATPLIRDAILDGREIRKTLLRGGSLRPEPATLRPVRSLPNAARFECDSVGFHAQAVELINRVGAASAAALEANPNIDQRLRVALRTILALPPSTRAAVLAQGRSRANRFAAGTEKLIPIGESRGMRQP